MANNFSDSHCKALWRFENNLLDSKGANNLTGVATPAFTTTVKEGTYALDNTTSTCAYINDSDLDAGFPLKSGDTAKNFTVCGWVRFDGNDAYRGIFTKWDWSGYKRCFETQRDWGTLKVNLGYSDGTQYTNIDTGIWIYNEWYHLAFVIDGKTNKKLDVYAYRAQQGYLEQRHFAIPNELWVGDAPFVIGAMGPTFANKLDAIFDEVVVFDTALSYGAIEKIRLGTFNGIVDSIRADSVLPQAAYYLDDYIQANKAEIQVAYGLVPNESYIQANNAGIYAVYAVNPAPVRVFPLAPPQRMSQTKGWKRSFPV
jgi:hypothetical protein